MSALFIIPRLVILFGTIVLTVVMIDAVLPKQVSTKTIMHISRGVEGGRKYGGKKSTHFKVHLDDNTSFPIFIDGETYFEVADVVVLSRSSLLGKPTFIVNKLNNYGSIPARGVFSYYFSVVILLFISLLYGIRYRRTPTKLINATVFIIFLTAFTLVLLI